MHLPSSEGLTSYGVFHMKVIYWKKSKIAIPLLFLNNIFHRKPFLYNTTDEPYGVEFRNYSHLEPFHASPILDAHSANINQRLYIPSRENGGASEVSELSPSSLPSDRLIAITAIPVIDYIPLDRGIKSSNVSFLWPYLWAFLFPWVLSIRQSNGSSLSLQPHWHLFLHLTRSNAFRHRKVGRYCHHKAHTFTFKTQPRLKKKQRTYSEEKIMQIQH